MVIVIHLVQNRIGFLVVKLQNDANCHLCQFWTSLIFFSEQNCLIPSVATNEKVATSVRIVRMALNQEG